MSRSVGIAVALGLVIAGLPLDADPAEAARIKLRYRTGAVYGSTASSNPADNADANHKARPAPEGRAAAAAERARAALEAEKAKAAPVSVDPRPAVGAETKGYANGVTCIAGC
jgi:hypothetical protein